MRAGWRTIVGVLAIYAVALHVILAGIVPAGAVPGAADPQSAICHGIPDDAAGQRGTAVPIPGHACEHCNLCPALAPPPAPETPLAGVLVPARVLNVLRPVSALPRIASASDLKLARGPPQEM